MPLIMNASSKEQTVQVHGAWFTFAAGAIKEMNENKVAFLADSRGYQGFVAIPDKFADLEARNSPEGKKELEVIRATGIANRVKHLEWLKNNELKALRKDMDRANIKSETETEMSGDSFDALQAALKELAGYKTRTSDTVKERQAVLKDLQAALTEE